MIYLKKIITGFLFSFLFFSVAHAGDTLYYVGSITIEKKVTYNYTLRFTIDSSNHLNGYSLTDPRGPVETKTRIFGIYDSIGQTISFEEKGILRSKVDLQKNDLCFVKATLKLKKTKIVEELSGNFTGVQPGTTTACATGTIKLINTARAKLLMAEMERVKNQRPNAGAEKDSGQNTIIKVFDEKGKDLAFTGNYLRLTVWDNGQVDGDRISIMLNGKYILENYTLDSIAKVIETTLPDNKTDTIKIIALNEGTLPPNTGVIRIESESELYPIEVQAKLNEIRTIYLHRKKK